MLNWGVWIYQNDLHNLRNIPIFFEAPRAGKGTALRTPTRGQPWLKP